MKKKTIRINFKKSSMAFLITALLGVNSITGIQSVYADTETQKTQSLSVNLTEQDTSIENKSTESASESKKNITANDVEDGSYPVEVQVVSGTVQISEATLTAENGSLTLHVTLKDGTTHDVKIHALDDEETFGSAKIKALSSSLPNGALKTTASQAYQPLTYKKIPLKAGTWQVNVAMEGGSGRASVKSPCTLTVDEDGKATAEIEWSSSHYDYMIVGGKKYTPVNHKASGTQSGSEDTTSEENSRFEIPVAALDEPETVIGDTTAMSHPYEIEYKLTFSGESAKKSDDEPKKSTMAEEIGGIILALLLVALAFRRVKRLRNRRRH